VHQLIVYREIIVWYNSRPTISLVAIVNISSATSQTLMPADNFIYTVEPGLSNLCYIG